MDEARGGPGDDGSASLLRLMTWLSPAFPVGAFGYSHGLETAIAEGRIRDADAAVGWIETLLTVGSGWNDLVLFAEAHRAALAGDGASLSETAGLARALAGSAERRLETVDLGVAFAEASIPWDTANTAGEALPYPVAVAGIAARHMVSLEAALVAYAHAFAANLLAASQRLIPLGQRDGVRVLHRLEPVVLAVAARAALSSLDDLGSAAILSDICALRHETTSPRLFRT